MLQKEYYYLFACSAAAVAGIIPGLTLENCNPAGK